MSNNEDLVLSVIAECVQKLKALGVETPYQKKRASAIFRARLDS
ncbi:MAG: hypothetical protein ACYCQJ_16165 [Nitrososphaerales archaeon]